MAWEWPAPDKEVNKPVKRTDEYRHSKFYSNERDIADLKGVVDTLTNKVYIIETKLLSGATIEIVGISKEYVDFVLYEVEKLRKKKAELTALADKTKKLICETTKDEKLEFEMEMKGTNWLGS